MNMSPDTLKMPETVVVLNRIKIIGCNKCSKAFIKQSDYKIHKMKHDLQDMREQRIEKNRMLYHNKKPGLKKTLKCDQCDMRFVAKSTLEAHSALHKPFPHVCNCGVGFYESNDLKSHKKIVHDNEEKEQPLQKKNKNGVRRKRNKLIN